jgi:formiminoglutamase
MSLFAKFDASCIELVRSEGFTSQQIGAQISICDADFFVQNKTPGLLLFTLCEEGEEDSTNMVRRALYTLFGNWPNLTLADAGHYVGHQEDLPETIREIRGLGFVPLLITPYQSSTYFAYASFCASEETVNLLSVDESPDLGEMTELVGEKNWLTHLISHTPNFLFNYSILAFQQYLSNPEALKILENFHFDLIRLGDVREKIKQTEPFFRNADLISFDLGAIRASDAGMSDFINPNGLYAEEACRLARYAGHGGKLKCVVFSGFPGLSLNAIGASLLAQLIWHLTDGYESRIDDGQIGRESDFITYTIGATNEAEELVFFKSARSGRWWMRVPSFSKSHGRSNRQHVVPCNYEDYVQALAGELPETWWRTHQKLA